MVRWAQEMAHRTEKALSITFFESLGREFLSVKGWKEAAVSVSLART